MKASSSAVEQLFYVELVAGSTPVSPTTMPVEQQVKPSEEESCLALLGAGFF